MLVLEKRRDIGVLRTMGCTPGGIMRIFVLQGTLVGVVGTASRTRGRASRCPTSSARYKLLHLPGEIYFIDTLPVKMEWPDFVFVASRPRLTCFLASLYPAWQAARLARCRAIRYE